MTRNGILPGGKEVLFCPMEKAKTIIIAEQELFPSSSPSGAGCVMCGSTVCSLLKERGTAPADVTGAGRGLTVTHDVTSPVQITTRTDTFIAYGQENVFHYDGVVLVYGTRLSNTATGPPQTTTKENTSMPIITWKVAIFT